MKIYLLSVLLAATVINFCSLNLIDARKKKEDKSLLIDFDTKHPNFNLLDLLLQDILPKAFGQPFSNVNGTASKFGSYVLTEKENDAAVGETAEQLIKRAKFKHETHYVVARDGYITRLIRLINPLVEKRHLKWPPVVLMHGGTIDNTCYLMSSTARHHPEHYPRVEKDPPFTSWNRSLAFVLSNFGYDVWITATRGSSQIDADHIKLHNKNRLREEMKIQEHERLANPDLYEFKLAKKLNKINYWNFTEDDIIDYELMTQFDTVMDLTAKDFPDRRERKISLVGFSLSVPLTLGFFADFPNYTRNHIHSYIALGPVVTKRALATIPRLILSLICPLIPVGYGTELVKLITSSPIHHIADTFSKSRGLRYTLFKAIAVLFFGPSGKYRALFERNVVSHLLRTFGFKQAKQLCQQLKADKLQKYDFGPLKNLKIYGKIKPPVYDLMHTTLRDWAIVATENDGVAGPEAVKYLEENVRPKPSTVIVAPKFDHFDIVGGVENGKYINLPMVKYLDSVSFSNNGDLKDSDEETPKSFRDTHTNT